MQAKLEQLEREKTKAASQRPLNFLQVRAIDKALDEQTAALQGQQQKLAQAHEVSLQSNCMSAWSLQNALSYLPAGFGNLRHILGISA